VTIPARCRSGGMSRLSRAVLLMVVALLAGCGDSETGGKAGGAWERLPDPPLSVREAATAVAVGSEALFLGGSDAPPCPPNASCVASGEPALRDGAAFDPAAGTWERIASAPVGSAGPTRPSSAMRSTS